MPVTNLKSGYTVYRLNQGELLEQGTADSNLKLSDVLPMVHSSSSSDNTVNVKMLKSIPFGTCSTAGATVGKTVTFSNYPAETLSNAVGLQICVKFTNENTATSPTLSAFGLSGLIKSSGNNFEKIFANEELFFTWNGTDWICSSGSKETITDEQLTTIFS